MPMKPENDRGTLRLVRQQHHRRSLDTLDIPLFSQLSHGGSDAGKKKLVHFMGGIARVNVRLHLLSTGKKTGDGTLWF